MDRVRDVDDGLDEGLVPLADGARELWTDLECISEVLASACDLVHEAAWAARPVVVGAVGLRHEVIEDLAVDLEGDLLREDRCELDFSVHRVIGVEVLCELWAPLGAELTCLSCDADRLDLDVDLWDDGRWCRAEVRFERWDGDRRADAAVD